MVSVHACLLCSQLSIKYFMLATLCIATNVHSAVSASPRLIVHVGPHKTGTTSFQVFLYAQRSWLLQNYGITLVGTNHDAGHYVANTLNKLFGGTTSINVDNAVYKRLLNEIKNKLHTSGSTVLLSSEGFSRWKDEAWRHFLRLVKADVSVVVAGPANAVFCLALGHKNPLNRPSMLLSATSSLPNHHGHHHHHP